MKKTMSFLTFGFILFFGSTVFAQRLATQNIKMPYDKLQVSDNYYVLPCNIFMAPNGMYVSIDGVLIQINMLCADERGVFVPLNEIAGRLVKCPHCQRWYDPDSKIPHKCRGIAD